ncbi:hypothetical protein L0Y41_03225 [bacterium]|nr:hypothetical protein [bacterium]
MASGQKIFSSLGSFFFPLSCLGCGKGGTSLCSPCARSLPGTRKSPIPGVFSLLDYDDRTVKKALRAFKYRGDREIATVFGELLQKTLAQKIQGDTDSILATIPPGKKRIRAFGFDHMRRIAEYVSSEELRYEKETLYRTREAPRQADIKKKSDRLKNMEGVFAVKNKDLIKEKQIVLIDDIATTGATLTEAKKALLRAGAKNVYCITIAR